MSTFVMTHKFQKIILSGEADLIDFDAVIDDKPNLPVYNGVATIELASGSSVQISPNATIDADAGLVTTNSPKAMIDIRKGHKIRATGSNGNILYVSILSD